MQQFKDRAEMLFEPTGDLAKDYSAYCEIDNKPEKDELFDAMKEVQETINGQQKMRTRFVLRNLDVCLNKRDIAPLCDAIPHCVNMDQLHLTGCGVTDYSIKLISAALYKSPAIHTVSIDFNPNRLYPDPTATNPNNPNKKDKNDVYVHPSHYRGGQLRGAELEKEQAQAQDAKKGGAKPDAKKPGGKQTASSAAAPSPMASDLNVMADADRSQLVSIPNGWTGLFLAGIQQLSLRGNGITDKQLEPICPLLEGHTELLSLSLWGNYITSTGAQSIAAALKTNRRLTALNLGHNKIDDAGAVALAQIFYSADVTNEDAGKLRQRTLAPIVPSSLLGSPQQSAAAAANPQLAELPATLPTFADLFNQPAADDSKKDPKKKDPKKKVEGPMERPKSDFDKDCIRLDENHVRVPGNTALWAVNLSHNQGITAVGAKAWIDMLRCREPAFGGAETSTAATWDGSIPPHYVGSSLALQRLDLVHPSLDAPVLEEVANALADNMTDRSNALAALRGGAAPSPSP